MQFAPRSPEDEAGLLVIQNSEHYYAFGLGRNPSGETVVRVRKRAGKEHSARGQTIAEAKVNLKPGAPIYLRMDIDKAELDFAYSLDGKHYALLIDNANSRVLSTAMAGGFTGAVIGMYAEGALGAALRKNSSQ